jgi:putative transposase
MMPCNLFLDGVYVRVKGTDAVQRNPVLVAYVITSTGEKQLVAYRVAGSKSEAAWEAFLNDLYRRGLEGKTLKLVVTDRNAGLHKALATVYPYVPRQRCWVHKLHNVMSKLPMRYQTECLGQLRMVYVAESKDNARNRYRIWSEKWQPLVPRPWNVSRKTSTSC